MEELDQGPIHPSIKHLETNMSRLGIESRPPASQAGTLPKSYLDGILILNSYTVLPQFMCHKHVIMTYTKMVAQICSLAGCQAAGCKQPDRFLPSPLHWASCWGTLFNVRQDISRRGHHYEGTWPYNKGSLHPSIKHLEPDLFRSQMGTLPKSYPDSLLIGLFGATTVLFLKGSVQESTEYTNSVKK